MFCRIFGNNVGISLVAFSYRVVCFSFSCSSKRFRCIGLISKRLKGSVQHFSESMATLETLKFDNLAIRKLPLDSEEQTYVRTVPNACFSRVQPSPVENPITVAYSASAFALLDLQETELTRSDFCEYFSGSKLLNGSQPSAHCYCGHQFGYFSGQLGDGAAMYLGEIINQKGERWELQLKGAGKTPYSRQADGRKVLRSSIREFLCSEAMHNLGIPTTRAGSCVTSDSRVMRDIFYDGHPVFERCTIISRIAPTFLRFGSFEIFNTMDKFTGRVGPSVGRNDILQQMLDYSIETFFPEIQSGNNTQEEKYKLFFKEVVLSTARLVAGWQCVGFCHGVLNTDNMSIMGLTIDYGPFGFMDRYDPDHICNASDDGGRYTFIKQPEICLWNLKKLAEAIQRALPLSESLPLLQYYYPEFEHHYLSKMRKKLGLLKVEDEKDNDLVTSLLDTMEESAADFTNTFRSLSCLQLPGMNNHEQSLSELKKKLLQQCYPLNVLIKANQCSIDGREFQLFMLLMQTNPELLEQLGKGPQAMERIMAKMNRSKKLQELKPEDKTKHDEQLWSKWLLKYKERLQKEINGIDDAQALNQLQKERETVMNNHNPRFILRNYIAENSISLAEKGCFEEVQNVLRLLENPYASGTEFGSIKGTKYTDVPVFDESNQGATSSGLVSAECYDGKPPDWAMSLRVT